MRLSDFIVRDMEAILAQWDSFAGGQLPAAAYMSPLALRDHAREILSAVAADLTTAQSLEEQSEKSKGRAALLLDAPETAAETHALLRANSGFDIRQLAAEYRALRASVLHLWQAAEGVAVLHAQDVIRFNEAIDQALAESIGFFSDQVEQARNLLLGMVGHDMRTPLQTIQLTASYLAALNVGADVAGAAQRLINSGARIQALLDDLVDLNRSNLGLGIQVAPSEVDVASLFADELDQLRAAFPERRLEFRFGGNTQGVWDGQRLQQLLGNLVVNAITYGAPDAPVRVLVMGDGPDLCFEVRNAGPALEPESLMQIFNPLNRGAQAGRDPAGGHLGLGLHISSEIVAAHEGDIKAWSEPEETVFAVRLPRRPGQEVHAPRGAEADRTIRP
jgi:signal transduction histidine kinase